MFCLMLCPDEVLEIQLTMICLCHISLFLHHSVTFVLLIIIYLLKYLLDVTTSTYTTQYMIDEDAAMLMRC